LQPKAFQAEFNRLLEAAQSNVTLVGRYEHAELAQLMAEIDWVVVPSIWWENSPLVIQEAFQYGRPVICSDIGGMAEKVTHGVNGLHFRVGNPASLAATILEAVSSPGLWEQLSGAIPDIYRMEDHVAAVGAIYRALLEGAPPSEGNARAG
jgi:glycosyltransferase involved in cell wall biosynthesis